MLGNRKLQSNVEDAMRSLKIESREDKNGDTGKVAGDTGPGLGPYPGRPGEPDCIYYLRTGTCGYGTNCRFNHPPNGQSVQNTGELPERVGQPDCGYYLKTGTCKYGLTCKYHHPKDRLGDSSVVFNSLGLPMRQDAKPCPYYMQTGLCKYGYACKFHHPQPMSAANVVPVAGHIVYGLGGSVVVPSSGAPSVGQLPESSLSKATYVSSSLLQAPRSFMPVVLSPVQGWNAYMGGINPVSVTSGLGLAVSNGQLSASHLPERPDQPECRYFMNNGSCKYGSDCKYNHPREKIMQSASNFLGPLGLPLRPGQPVCVYYTLYGLCKYGPTCKFDHPMEGYSSYTAPSPPVIPTPWLPYQKMSSLVPLSETSSSISSKFTDWIREGATSHKNGDTNTDDLGDMPGRSDYRPHSSKASSEILHNESD
ncbi:Zinc finger CCCH domain-containing protein 3 [Forsythia ovata]|uniref:Zinc finger CCCH domain-containing protein 3 n=1 Tax=Forsythia ovata TaxID=205694 RepID=A0ABD1RYT6_9LAMI